MRDSDATRDDTEDGKLIRDGETRPAGLKARAASFLHVRDGEWRMVTLVMALMFVPSAGTAIGIASAESLFLSRVGADALPVLYIALGLVTIVTTFGITALLARIAPVRLYLLMPVALALLLACARFLVEIEIDGIYRGLWVVVFVIDTFTRMVTWGIAGISFDTRQAKRLYPLLVAAGILGYATGGLSTNLLVDMVGTDNLLLVWAITQIVGLGLVRVITRATGTSASAAEQRAQRRRRSSLRDDIQAGLQYVRRSRLMRWVAASAVLFHALFFFLAFSFSQAVEMAHPVEDDMTAFLGTFRGVTTGAALLISLLIATRFNARFGLMAGFLALAVFDLLAFSALSISSPFMAIVAFRFLHEAWQTGITRTAWYALFNIVPPVRREQTRMFVNGVCLQVGIMLVGIILLAGTELLDRHQLYIIGAIAAGLTLFAVIRARAAYLNALVEALRAGRPQVFSSEEDPFRSFQQDASAMNVAMAGLSDPDPAVRRVAADVLSNLDVPVAVPSLVDALADRNVDVRVTALPALARLEATSAWDDVVTCLSDSEARVRAQAISTLRRLSTSGGDFLKHVEPMLDDRVPSVRAAAAVSLLSAGHHERALETLRKMATDSEAESRVEALESLGAWGDGTAFEPTQAALGDPQPAVRRAAASALGRINDSRCAEALVRSLGDKDGSVREAVATSIGAIGLPVLGSVVKSLDDCELEDGALLALEELPVEPQAEQIRAYATNRVTRALHYHRLWRHARLLARDNDRAQLLLDSLRHNAEHHGFNALRAIGALGDSRAVAIAIDSLKSPDPIQRANAIETLDSISDRDIVRPVLRVWEPPDDGARASPRLTPEQTLHQSLQDADSWVRACAILAADGTDRSEIRSQIEKLAHTDPDSTVREAAAAASDGGRPMQTMDTLSLMERILFLKRVPLFARLSPGEVKQVATIADEHLFVDGEVIAEQNEPGDELYVIVSGEVRVMVTGDDGGEEEIAIRGSGEYVGEMAVISRKPRMAKLVAAGDVRALCIGQKQFEGILRERPDTSLAVMRELCDRLRERESAAH